MMASISKEGVWGFSSNDKLLTVKEVLQYKVGSTKPDYYTTIATVCHFRLVECTKCVALSNLFVLFSQKYVFKVFLKHN